MQLLLQADKQVWRTDETVVVRLLVLNDSYEPTVVDRRWLVGPNLVPRPGQMPLPVQVEPAFPEEEWNRVHLNPWCLYGRQRSFDLPAGEITFSGYLLGSASAMLPGRPAEAGALLAEAEPIVLIVR